MKYVMSKFLIWMESELRTTNLGKDVRVFGITDRVENDATFFGQLCLAVKHFHLIESCPESKWNIQFKTWDCQNVYCCLILVNSNLSQDVQKQKSSYWKITHFLSGNQKMSLIVCQFIAAQKYITCFTCGLPISLDHDCSKYCFSETGGDRSHALHVHPKHVFGHSLNMSVTHWSLWSGKKNKFNSKLNYFS